MTADPPPIPLLPTEGEPEPEPQPRRKRRRWPWVLAAVVAVPAVIYAADVALSWGDTPRNTSAFGVPVGGMPVAEAEAVLAAEAEERAENEIQALHDGRSFPVVPARVGMELDAEATLAPVAGTEWNPVNRVRSLFEPTELDAVVTAGKPLNKRLKAIGNELGTTRTDANVRFDGATPVPVYPKDGIVLDVAAAKAAVTGSWLPNRVVELPMTPDPAQGTRKMVNEAILQYAAPAVAAPVEITAVNKTESLQPDQIAAAIKFRLEDGALQPRVNPAALRKSASVELANLSSSALNATVQIVGQSPIIIPSANGWEVTPKQLAGVVGQVMLRPPPRAATVLVEQVEPAVTTAMVRSWGIKEQISTYTTYHDCCQPRVTNIQTMAQLLDGYVIPPGEEFSLNGAVGPRDTARGFVPAPMIYNGEFRESVGGGISQFATTLFNAVFFGGLEDVAHTPHSYYISRYPPGREATVSWPAPALKFRNDSKYGVVIDTSYTPTSITVSLYSTRRYDIEAITGPKHSYTTAPIRYLTPSDECLPASSAPGFSITNTRVFKKNGVIVKTEDFPWTYKPQPEMVCGDAPAEGTMIEPVGR